MFTTTNMTGDPLPWLPPWHPYAPPTHTPPIYNPYYNPWAPPGATTPSLPLTVWDLPTMEPSVVQMNALTTPERSRTYHFPAGKVTLKEVTHLCVRPSGTHRLKTADGRLHIVPTGWVHIDIDADDWSL